MSLSTQAARIRYTITSTGQTLAFPYYFLASADLDVVRTRSDVDTTLTLNTHYTVADAGEPAGGSVTLTTDAAAVGDTITIYRAASFVQPAEFPSGGQFPSATVEQSLDRLTMLLQQMQLNLERCYRLPLTADALEPSPLAALVALVAAEVEAVATSVGVEGNLVYIGNNALAANTTGESNVAVGYGALAANTSGANNVAVGALALTAQTTGYASTAVGVESLKAQTTGNSNVAVGYRTGLTVTTGKENTLCGQEAGAAITTSDASTAVGYRAFYNGNGTRCTAVGYQALLSSTTGTENTAVGMNAMQALIEGSGQVAVGVNALYSLTHDVGDSTTNDHVGIGKSAGHFLTTSKRTTLVGGFCGYGLTTQDGNTMVGYKAGYTASGNRNVVVGAQAESSTYSDCIVLGAGATASADNQLVIGNGGGGGSYAIGTQTTIGANGAATALTANPLGYLKIRLNGSNVIIPYYNA